MKQLKSLTNSVYLKNNFIIKVSNPNNDLYLNKKNEFNVLTEFMKTNQNIIIKPKSYYFSENRLYSTFKYLKKFKSLEEIKLSKKICTKVCLLIKDFHDININLEQIKEFDYKFMLNFFDKNIQKHIFDLKLEVINILKEITIFKKLKQFISHNDLVPGNILLNRLSKKIILIDYDYVMKNNKFFDIASFITETCNENEKFIFFFVTECLNHKIINESELKILDTCIAYQDILWTLWANYMFERTNNNLYLNIAHDKYNRVINRKKITDQINNAKFKLRK